MSREADVGIRERKALIQTVVSKTARNGTRRERDASR